MMLMKLMHMRETIKTHKKKPAILTGMALCLSVLGTFGRAGRAQARLDLCSQIPNAGARGECNSCMDNGGMWTAIGCLQTDAVSLVASLVEIGMGIGGLLLTIQIIIGGGEIIFGGGDPAKIASAKKRVTNSIIALLFIVFGVVILRLIGVNILMIPGFFN